MKIIVYAISKNEEKFVDRWVDSMQEADEIIVLDTGSTDKTVEKLKKRNVKVYEEKIYPLRFDTARNESLAKVPQDADICVCTDLDEVFVPGWREILENYWSKEHPTRAKYTFNWKLDEQNNPQMCIRDRAGVGISINTEEPKFEIAVNVDGTYYRGLSQTEVVLNKDYMIVAIYDGQEIQLYICLLYTSSLVYFSILHLLPLKRMMNLILLKAL